MTHPSSHQKNPILAILFLFLFISGGMGIAGYLYLSAQSAKLKSREAEIGSLRADAVAMSRRIQDAETEGKKLIEDNALMKQSMEKFEGEKTTILNQVRSSISSFETFRAEATSEIETLKNSLTQLQTEKQDLSRQLENTENLSKSDKENLSGQIEDLTKKIEDHNVMEAKLAGILNAKESTSMVSETAKLYFNLGNFYFKHRNFKNAVREYEKAIFYLPDDADSHFNLAVTSDQALGDRPMAILHYKRYLEIVPKARDAKKIQERILDLEMEEKVFLSDPANESGGRKGEDDIFKEPKTDVFKFSIH